MPDGGKDGTGVEGRNYIVGNASFDGIGKCKAYLIKNSDVFIQIETESQIYLINDESSD